MASLLSGLSKTERRQLLEDLNYLNMSEIKRFCDRHSIPYKIWIEAAHGERRRTPDNDRKGIILKRVRHYISTGKVPDATVFTMSVVNFDKLPSKIKSTDKLFYGQYDKNSRRMTAMLKQLTNGEFKNGAVARIVAREFWSSGKAPTFEEFAAAWMKAMDTHKRPNPEWAFLSDLAEKKDVSNWKQKRVEKAKQVLQVLARMDGK